MLPIALVNEIDQILSKVANPTKDDGSTLDGTDAGANVTEGGQQGLTKLGRFLGPATGAWSSNDLIPLQDDNGNIVTVDLDGQTTLRLTFNQTDGDLDYLLFYCLDCSGGTTGPAPKLSLSVSGSNLTVNSDTAGTTLEATDALGGTWTGIGTAPQTVPISGKAKFIRGKK